MRLVGAQGPFGIVQVELRIDLTEVHARFEISIQGADVPPVFRGLLVFVVEAIRIHGRRVDERGNDVLAEIVGALARGILLEGADDRKGVACLGGECFGAAGQGFIRFSCAEPDERLVEAVKFFAEVVTRTERVKVYLAANPKYRM